MTEYAIDIKYGFTDAQTAELVKPGTIFKTNDRARFENIIKLGLGTPRYIHHSKTGTRVMIHQKLLYKIGGIETANYNMAKTFKDKNLTFCFNNYDMAQLLRLAKYASIEIDDGQRRYETDVLILANYDSGEIILDRVKAKRIYNQCHADWLNMEKLDIWKDFTWTPDERIDKVLAVSDTTQHALEQAMGIKSEIVPNILAEPGTNIKTFLIMSRATVEKGIDRVFRLYDEFIKAEKEFVMYICSAHLEFKPDIYGEMAKRPRIIPVEPSPYNGALLKAADYLIQLSYNESYCYSVREALQRKVPCIVSDIPEFRKIIKDGVNGFIIKDDFSNVDADKIFNAKLKLAPYKEPVPEIWQKVLEGKL